MSDDKKGKYGGSEWSHRRCLVIGGRFFSQEIFVDDCAYFAATQTRWRVERATRLSHFLDKRATWNAQGDNGSSSLPTMDATPLAAAFHRKSELMCLIRTIRRERASLAYNRYPLNSPRPSMRNADESCELLSTLFARIEPSISDKRCGLFNFFKKYLVYLIVKLGKIFKESLSPHDFLTRWKLLSLREASQRASHFK